MIFLSSWHELEKKQHKVVKLLTNSMKNNRLSHAYLFEGSVGTGKKEISLQLTKSFFCRDKNAEEPCNKCTDCKRINSGNHPDAHIIAPSGLSIKKEQIEQLVKEFGYAGVESKKKVYIIEDAEKMTPQAANSLLKFIEEPREETVAILITSNLHRMLNTIISRCQVISFAPLNVNELLEKLKNEGIPENIAKLAASLTSDFQEAKDISSDEWFAEGRNKVLKLTEDLFQKPEQAFIFLQERFLSHFSEKEQLEKGLSLLLLWFKDLLYLQLGQEEKVVFIDQIEKMKQLTMQMSQRRIVNRINVILEGQRKLHSNMNPQLLMEQVVLKMQEG
ncbi:DNA polymerase III subunit delta' [Lottiidibacillus patelloidae]|uniref:DNA polymerase III subunit delta' n=1 Tax=Lottiidibacillus patelloidae TaxID=2670334 RepID=UPI002FCDFBC4